MAVRAPSRTAVVAYRHHLANTGDGKFLAGKSTTASGAGSGLTNGVYMVRSRDFGLSWEDPIEVFGARQAAGDLRSTVEVRKAAEEAETGAQNTAAENLETGGDRLLRSYSSPSLLCDLITGRLFMMVAVNAKRVEVDGAPDVDEAVRLLVGISDDEGDNWGYSDITTYVNGSNDWQMHSAGPGHGIQMMSGTWTGRLIQPAVVDDVETTRAVTVCSDDRGLTWWTSQPVGENITYASVAEMADGTLMMRTLDTVQERQTWWSYDAGRNWSSGTREEEIAYLDSPIHDIRCSTKVERIFPCAPVGTEHASTMLMVNRPVEGEHNVHAVVSLDDARTQYSEVEIMGDDSMSVHDMELLAMPDVRMAAMLVVKPEGLFAVHVDLDDLGLFNLAKGWNAHTEGQEEVLRAFGFDPK
ncbi:MAG: sialidase family protein [Varibaculum sp.]|nr:sialidase family protein [Varibaculum sp.]